MMNDAWDHINTNRAKREWDLVSYDVEIIMHVLILCVCICS